MVLQCVACIQKENRKFCLAAEGLGNRLCYLEPTSEAKVGTVTPLSEKHSAGTQRCMSLVWDVSAQLLDHRAPTSFGGVCFLCSYIINYMFTHAHAHTDTNIINKCHMKQFAEK